MKFLPAKATAIASLILISGCASMKNASTPLDYTTGVYVPQETLGQFKPGKATQDQVAAAIGYPSQRNEVLGKEVWTYTYTKIAGVPFVGSNKFENTVFEWNKNGTLLKSYKSAGTPGQSGNPLLNAAGM
ncbi:outer membrane protein assembly factor BamE [Pseudomonas sp. WS 5011]|uniref:outer membrane protein assembly factor BamE n=1 Tax=Pseudomonas sp. WS 5011 TaxID=2717477 RepID=UPI001473C8A7|nr:outer membrane protein assembly factor BamE [Pseudomonas sp. WS 5011]NMY52005.1 outer membrane protein assembly factor BamE [Pseudomonas sp. WS 5011]